MPGGEKGEVLSVSWPEAPPGIRSCRLACAEGVAVFDARVGENPVVRGEDLVRRGRHNPRMGKDHAEQVGLGLVVLVKAAIVALGPLNAPVAVFDLHRLLVEQLHLAVEAVAAQVHEFAAALAHPRLDVVVHLARPVLGMGGGDEDFVLVEVELAKVKLGLGVQVVGKALAL